MYLRRSIWCLAVLLASTASAVGQVAPAKGLGNDTHPWPMRHANAARTGQSDRLGPRVGAVAWQEFIPGFVPHFAVDRLGKIYLGAVFHEEWWSYDVYAPVFNSAGSVFWRAKVKPYDWGMSQGISASPALDADGNILFPSTAGELIKFSPAGAPLWKFHSRDDSTHDSSPAVLEDGSVLIYRFPGLSRIDKNGNLLWTNGDVITGTTSVSVSPNGDMALGGVRTNEPHGAPVVFYLNADGSLRWSVYTSNGSESTPVFGPDGTLYVNAGSLTAYHPNGSVRWSTDGYGYYDSPALSDGGIIYMAANALTARDAQTGGFLWSASLPGEANNGLAIDRRGVVYLTTSNGYLVAVDSTGALLFQKKICDSFHTGPAIGALRDATAAGKIGFEYYVFNMR